MKAKKEKKPGSSTTKLEEELAEITSELKRKNRDLEIEAALERMRTVAMGMNKQDDLLNIARSMFDELLLLGFSGLRNVLIHTYFDEKKYFTDYNYSDFTGELINRMPYSGNPIHEKFLRDIRRSKDAFTEIIITGEELEQWKKFRDSNNEVPDERLSNHQALYYYMYSVGDACIGISAFAQVPADKQDVLKRFRNVFDLAYRRYVDITQAEAQAHEAQIELGLERVRARAMAMQTSGQLADLVTTLFNELAKLDFALSWCMINIIDGNSLTNTVWAKNADEGGAPERFHMKFEGYPFHDAMWDAWKGKLAKFVYTLEGGEKKIYDEYLFNETEFSRLPETVKAGMRATERYVASFSFSNFGGLQTVGDQPLSDASLDILSRFGKVFDLTYTRFNDLKLAETQAHEAQIELALERVRSRAMAMHKTDELRDAAELLYKELTGLGISTHTVCYVLVNAENKTGLYYGINPVDGQVTPPTVVPHTETKVMRAMWASWLKQEPVHFIQLDQQASIEHQTYIGKLIAAAFAAQGVAPEFTVEGFLSVSPERVHIYSLNFKQGYLFLVGGAPLPAADVDILTRFTKVFELTYTRFLDIKKAEEQAREGRIELALERVRARTMAMQHSDELAETAYILFQQFRELGENPDQATIGIINEAEGVIEYWVTIYGNQTNRVFKFPIDEPNVTRKIYNAWRAQEKSLVIDLGGQALYDFSKFRESMGGAGYNEAEQRRIINVAFFSKGLINVQSTVTRSAESLRLLERFANVFEGTYTRFLDLKKAEAQAREGQIELALERVRARAMAMRDSKELSEMVSTVFGELTKLDFSLTRCAIVIADSESGGRMIWMANSEAGQPPISFYRKSLDHPYPNAVNEEWKKRTTKWVYHLKGAEKKGMDDYYANSEEVAHLSSVIKQAMDMPESIILSHSFNNFGYLRADSLEFLSEANLDILYRFAKVFDLGYTRFTDIKQAEAQAREAQIELALERVRAKTMAMQHSDELLETSQVVFQQLRDLGETADQISIAIVKEDEGIFDLFATIYGTQMVRVVHPKIDDHYVMGRVYKNWKAHKKSFVVELGGEELRQYNILRNQLGALNYYNEDIGPDDRWIVSAASFSKGLLSFSSSTEPTKEAGQLLERFAKVFDSTYTRFLDLQKAEAQARESQIQLALERVRARTMAMQKSDELAETVSLVFKQLLALGIRTEQIRTCGIVTFNDNEPVGEQWITETNGEIIPQSFMVPYNEAPAYKSIYKGWKAGEKFMVIHLEGKALKEHLGYLAKGTNVPTRDVVLPQQAKEIFNHVLFFLQGCLFIITKEALPEYHDVFKRFGAVFQQSYTRFLDLKKAEAQAREGQIQLAMERVRARTMAMQHSDELMEASHLLDSQVRALGIRTRGCAFNIYGENESTEWFGLETGPLVYKTPREEAFLIYYEAGQRGESLYINEFAADACKAHYEYLCTLPDVGDALKKMRENGRPFPAHQIDHVVYFKFGYLLFATFEPVPEAHDIFKRFAAVFEQTYTRFLDLKHAEEQARDAKIEAALERTRTQSMIMQHSNELDDTLRVFHEQILHLGIDSAFSFLWLPDEEKDRHIFWAAWAENASKTFKSKAIDYPLDRSEPATAQCLVDWKGNDPVVSYHVPPEGVKNYFAAWQELIDGVEQLKPEYFQDGLYYVEAFMKYGCFGVMVKNGLADDDKKILGRMAIEFERTYTRFLDLKKAEAQTREAEIELGLERVRARTMAMQKSDELQEIIKVVYEQLVHLNIAVEHAGFIMDYNTRDDMHIWLTDKHYAPAEITVPYFDCPHWNGFNEAKEKGKDFFAIHSTFEEKNKFYRDLFKLVPGATDETKEYYFSCPGLAISTVLLENVGLYIENFSGTPYADDENSTLMRFGKVFQQTYTRFLDLQKAESQAREAQIEAALERVRSKTMAMHNSEDVGDTIIILFDELTRLGFATLRCSIDILNDTRMMEIWTAKPGKNGKADLVIGHLDTALHPMLGAMYNAWKAHEPDFFYELAGDDQARYLTALNEYAGYAINYEIASMPARQFLNTFFFADGGILAWTAEPLHAEASLILTRFASVFGQTYRRYLDLQKAETQAREAQIEMALERVRAVAMSMRKPGELLEISQTIFTQLKALDFADLRNTEIIINSDEKASVLSYYYSDYGVTGIIEVFFNEHPTVKAWAKEMQKANDAFTGMVIPEDEIAAWRKYREEIGYKPDPKLDEAKEVFYYSYSIGLGGLSISSFTPINDDQKKILERFRNVFNLSYQRYADIARAEEQAREAIKQASLDRVRAEIASMRTTGDLERITPLIWNELTILGIPFIRCGVFIVDEQAELIHTHLSTPDGRALAAFDLHFDADGIGQNVLAAWRKKQSAVIHWTAEEFAANTKSQVERGAVKARERFVTEHPNTSLDLHFFPFLQGMLYVGNIEPLSDDAKDLVQSLAEAFSTAYARYEDFNKLEAAKQQVDKTLTDLKSAQTQLIQTEKMASLGELTAGIAHEIQNPLNFVNNFSEVNAELIEEMKDEIEKGDLEEIRALALDIEENSKKINQHGKRADGIVKGMLQHSQSGSGVKELTNINSVADEYMRLAYHGLRAKDKSFNAEMHTHFDATLPKINVIPQDIGRVLLNLFNNAFYAVNQKMKTAGGDYKPMVEVETFFLPLQGVGGLKVKDNGIGIPDAIKEKIMQPFFTTKPTGEGTGLGLSLTYDMVVKGHGGNIQVNSVEGEGSEFIIKLPVG